MASLSAATGNSAMADREILEAEKLPGPLFYKLLVSSRYPLTNVEPSMYLGAISELLAGTIVLCFIITWLNDCVTGTNKLWDNPIHNMVGYNNPCAFWDQPPALYFAFLAFCPMVYLAIRYAHLDSLRAKLELEKTRSTHAISAINWLYAASQCIVMGIFVVTPMVSMAEDPKPEDVEKMHYHMRLHSAFFLQLVPCLCLAIVANYYEAYKIGQSLSMKQYVAVVFYICTTLVETVCASIAIFTYKGRYLKDEPQFYQINPIIMQVVDYAWFISLPLVTILSPPAPNMIINYRLNPEEIGAPVMPEDATPLQSE